MSEPCELARSIVHLYLSLMRHQRSVHQQIKKETGQSGRRMAILRCLLEKSPRTVGEIGRYLYVSDATVSRIVDDMEGHGLVTRRRCQADSRRVLVEPTEAGRELVETAPKSVVALMRERLVTLPVEELEAIEAALASLSELVGATMSVSEE